MSNQCRLKHRIRFDTLEHFEGNIFIRDMGDSLALNECKKVIMTLSADSEYCYTHIKLYPSGYLDKENDIIKFNSIQRPCEPNFPRTVIKTQEGLFLSQEPNLMKIMYNYFFLHWGI